MGWEVDVLDSIYERIETHGSASLTSPERHYLAVRWLEGEVANGSLEQFFCNFAGMLAAEALDGLRAIGAGKAAELLQAAISLFPSDTVPRDRDERVRRLEAFSPDQLTELDRLSRALGEYPDDLPVLIDTYLTENDDQFKGPRTALELWQSKRARGADTTPRLVTQSIDLDEEAAADQRHSSRDCPECGYPSPDYRETCKRCGFPHGRVKPK